MPDLIRYDAMCRAIEAAYEVDEVKEIRDRALAIEVYARQALNIDAERLAVAIRIRAERRVGELRRREEKNKGAATPGPQGTNRPPTNAARRAELGLSEKQDKRWQKLASLPQDEFEAALAEPGIPSADAIMARIARVRSKPMDDHALWLWGRILDFERKDMLADDPARIWGEMAEHMRETMRRLVPQVEEWLAELMENDHARDRSKKTA